MYTPEHFAETNPDVLHRFIREHPLGALIDTSLGASHLPMLLHSDGATLRCHIARANPQWRTVAHDPSVLVIFTGPEHYICPAWYPSKAGHGKAVPTWNYIAVHVYGRATIFEGDALFPHLEQLTAANESAHRLEWRIADAPRSYIDSLTSAIVGIEIAIERIEGKWKMSQNRPAADRAGVIQGLADLGSHRSSEVCEAMRKLDRDSS